MISLFDCGDSWPARPEPKIPLALDVTILWGNPRKITVRADVLPALLVTRDYTPGEDLDQFLATLGLLVIEAIDAISAPRRCSQNDCNDINARLRAGLHHRLA
jgi:hypothetical protein